MEYFIGIDVGTSGTKTILVAENGTVLDAAYAEYPLSQPFPGWAEQDPEAWWQATVASVREVLHKTGVAGNAVAGVGLSGQMHGAVFLDKHGKVLRPAILWCDQRTGGECARITENIGLKTLYEWTGNPALPGFTAPKIMWLREHEPEVYSRVRQILLPKDYIRFRLTGAFATEVSDASGTLLLDVAGRRWSDEMLAALGIAREWLPAVYESPEISAAVNAEAASLTGLPAGTPVAGGGGDQAAGAVGTGIVKTGVLSAALGTSGVVFAMTDNAQTVAGDMLHTFCHAVPGKWHKMGVMLAAGASLQWFRNTLAAGCPYDQLTQEAAAVDAGAGGLIFLPYLLGERTPYPDPAAKGAFIGLTMRHSRGHMVRAILEGVSFGLRDSLDLLTQAGVPVHEIRASGGGARSALWRNILAGVLGYPVTTVNSTEGPAYGAALLAAVGVGAYASVEEACAAAVKVTTRTEATPSAQRDYRKLHEVYMSLYPLLKNTMHRLDSVNHGMWEN